MRNTKRGALVTALLIVNGTMFLLPKAAKSESGALDDGFKVCYCNPDPPGGGSCSTWFQPGCWHPLECQMQCQ